MHQELLLQDMPGEGISSSSSSKAKPCTVNQVCALPYSRTEANLAFWMPPRIPTKSKYVSTLSTKFFTESPSQAPLKEAGTGAFTPGGRPLLLPTGSCGWTGGVALYLDSKTATLEDRATTCLINSSCVGSFDPDASAMAVACSYP